MPITVKVKKKKIDRALNCIFDINNFHFYPKETRVGKVQQQNFTFATDTAFLKPITDNNLNNVLKYFLNNAIYLEILILLCFSLRIISFEIRSIKNANLLGKNSLTK